MSIKDQLMSDLKEAMKAKDPVRKATVTMLRAQIKQVEVDTRQEVEDEGVLEIIARQVKQKRAAILDFEKAQRQDLVEESHREIEILMTYMPTQMTQEAVQALVLETISDLGAQTMKDMGKVMGALAPKTKGRADNKLVSDIVRAELMKG